MIEPCQCQSSRTFSNLLIEKAGSYGTDSEGSGADRLRMGADRCCDNSDRSIKLGGRAVMIDVLNTGTRQIASVDYRSDKVCQLT
jgi:hypothetical protein